MSGEQILNSVGPTLSTGDLEVAEFAIRLELIKEDVLPDVGRVYFQIRELGRVRVEI